MIIVMSGDVFYAVMSGGLVIAFTGAGLSVATSWGARLTGVGLFLVGTGVILSTMAGITGVFARFVGIG